MVSFKGHGSSQEYMEAATMVALIEKGARISDLPYFPALSAEFCGSAEDLYGWPSYVMQTVAVWLSGLDVGHPVADLAKAEVAAWVPTDKLLSWSPGWGPGAMGLLESQGLFPVLSGIEVLIAAFDVCDRFSASHPDAEPVHIAGMQVWLGRTAQQLLVLHEAEVVYQDDGHLRLGGVDPEEFWSRVQKLVKVEETRGDDINGRDGETGEVTK